MSSSPTTDVTHYKKIPTTKLHNGVDMPLMSLGLAFWNVVKGGVEKNPEFIGFLPEQAYRTILLALENDIRTFDTALVYRSHPMMQKVLGDWMMHGKLHRDDFFITTKVYHPMSHMGTSATAVVEMDELFVDQIEEVVEHHVDKSLHELGLGYVDLMLLHWPADFNSKNPQNRSKRLAAWKVLETYYEKGWLRAIGVSNFSEVHLEQLMDDGATIKPMVNQIEASVYVQWTDIVAYCKEHDILVEAFSPLGHGAASVLEDETVKTIAEKHSRDCGQVAMRYLIQKGYALTFSSSSPERLVSNQEIFDFTLDDADMEELDALNGTAEGTGQPSPYDMA